MSVSSELGISPVLLQAIRHKIATKGHHPPSNIKTVYNSICYKNLVKNRAFQNMNVLRDESVSQAQKVVAHILQDMNEPVSELLARRSANQEHLELDQSNTGEHLHKVTASGDHSDLDLLRQQLVKNQSFVQHSEQLEIPTENADEQIITCITDSDMSMVNVLTAIASHHLKSSRKSVSMPVQFVSTPAQGSKSTDDATTNLPQSQYVVCYGDDVLPSPAANDIVVSQADSPVSMDYMQNIFVNQHAQSQDHGLSPAKKLRTELHPESNICESNSNFITEAESNGSVSVVVNPDTGSVYHVQTGPTSDGPAQNVGIGGPCPICGDRVSGYHYGIFSCESCKGFFKRTVQNKKSFVCVRSADCQVNIANRKKCPACRFEKCLSNGMKLEAIRSDRTRGGRSYYDGCSPHGKSKPGQGGGVSQSPRLHMMVQQNIPDTSETDDSHLASSSSSQLVAILNRPSKADKTTDDIGSIKPYVPQILTDIMNLESFLSDEDLSQEMGQEKLNEDDMYTSLMQLTELRLYKLVRWARNLPQFSAIATDDQILLLQHCWSDLLVLGVCWPSIQSANELRLAFGKSIDRERAIAMDIEDMYDRMMTLTAQLRRLHVDNYEYVALKVLILISPDVKGLKDPERIRDQQDKICDALHVYTGSHYPKYPNKFGEMLLRLPEISRCSIIGKEYLSSRQITGDLPSCSLLLELIRGENEVKES